MKSEEVREHLINITLNHAVAICNEDILTKEDEGIEFLQKIFMKSIEMDPTNPTSYFDLASTLSNGVSTITLLNQSTMTKQQLLIKSIDLDCQYLFAYMSIGLSLPSRRIIR